MDNGELFYECILCEWMGATLVCPSCSGCGSGEQVWQWNLEVFLKLQTEEYKEYLENYTKCVRGVTLIDTLNL